MYGQGMVVGCHHSLLLYITPASVCQLSLTHVQVQMVKLDELRKHLPRDCLPQHLGGLLPLDATSWNQQLLAGQNDRIDPVDELVGIPVEETSVHVPGPESMRPQELLTHLGRLQRSGIHLEYEEFLKEPQAGTFNCSL